MSVTIALPKKLAKNGGVRDQSDHLNCHRLCPNQALIRYLRVAVALWHLGTSCDGFEWLNGGEENGVQ